MESARSATPGHTVVVGASLAGLFAAAAASSAGNRVTVLERDELPDQALPRPGVPQGQQPHVFLRRGFLALEDLLPDLRAGLLAQGAVAFDTGDLPWLSEHGWLPLGRPAFEVLSLTRPLFEHVVRAQVSSLTGVELRGRSRVTGLRRVGGRWQVELADGEVGPADLVVDASGRGSRLPTWLRGTSVASAATTEIDAHVGYAARLYASDGRFDGPGVVTPARPENPVGGLALRVEDDRFIVLAVGYGDGRPGRDHAGFAGFLDRLPDPALADLTRSLTPVSDVLVYRQTANRRHHYEKVRDWPDGLVVIGDAFCTFNPVYGQGIAVAACEALVLRQALARGLRPGDCRRVMRRFASVTALPWAIATSGDLRYDSCPVDPSPAQSLLSSWTSALTRLAVHGDERAADVLTRVYHLMAPPALLLHPALPVSLVRDWLGPRRPPPPRPACLSGARDG